MTTREKLNQGAKIRRKAAELMSLRADIEHLLSDIENLSNSEESVHNLRILKAKLQSAWWEMEDLNGR